MKVLTHFAQAALLTCFASASTAQAVQESEGDALAAASVPDPVETLAPPSPGTPADIIVPASETALDDWLWIKRPIVVFADSPADPRYVEQLALLNDRLDVLDERDVIIITDTDPKARSGVRRQLRARGFMLVIMAKDGSIVARKPAPWDVREISRSIDKLPLRQQEIRDRHDGLR